MRTLIELKEFDEGIEFLAVLKNHGTYVAAYAEKEFVEKYRHFLMKRRGVFSSLLRHICGFLCILIYLIILVFFIKEANSFYIKSFLAATLLLGLFIFQYLWRYGLQISALRARIRRRTEEVGKQHWTSD